MFNIITSEAHAEQGGASPSAPAPRSCFSERNCTSAHIWARASCDTDMRARKHTHTHVISIFVNACSFAYSV